MAKDDNRYDNKIPTNRYGERFSSQIRDIKIFLPTNEDGDKTGDRESEDNGDLNFVGRERVSQRLFDWLSKSGRGSYLVTGFRGMGKTTIVDRTVKRLTRRIDQKVEKLFEFLFFFIVVLGGLITIFCHEIWKCIKNMLNSVLDCIKNWCGLKLGCIEIKPIWLYVICAVVVVVLIIVVVIWLCKRNNRKSINEERKKFKNPSFEKIKDNQLKKKLQDEYKRNAVNRHPLLDKLIRGNRIDETTQEYSNIKITVNLGHEVLKERDILGLIATNIRDKYKEYVKSIQPRCCYRVLTVSLLCLSSIILTFCIKGLVSKTIVGHIEQAERIYNTKYYYPYISYYDVINPTNTKPELIDDNWFSRTAFNTIQFCGNLYHDFPPICLFVLYTAIFFIMKKLLYFVVRILPLWGTPARAIKRLDTLADRIVATTDEESGGGQSMDKSWLSINLFGRRRRKTMPIANIREIETELADIINDIAENCTSKYKAQFLIVFDEMDKIDPALVEKPQSDEMPEFTDSVKGFPDGMDSRERRRNVLKLLANIKLFVNTAKAKFVFISGRELYDAYLADLSDRDFAISSIFTGVLNVDSFLTPEGGQTDVRSMSEWYIANRLIPRKWMEDQEYKNATVNHILKQEKPSLKWYYEYLVKECKIDCREATFVIGFLHTYAAYLTHISNGSPKKIYLYFEKYIRKASDCLPMNDWQDICEVGKNDGNNVENQNVLYFDATQQRTINFVYYLANPIMGTITNDLSNYGDRFLVSLSFIIDHIYKHHSRSFSWRNMEQIPDLLKTSKAPELRDSVTSLMEYLTQIHISTVLIGLNEYKFHKSIAEEISVISKLSDEASAIFNFTLDESMSVIQHNTRLLNYYKGLADKDDGDDMNKVKYKSIISRIHSNLGDLHYWDEDYYAASLEYRAAIESLPKDEEDQSGFLTKMRCMLKLGLTYEMRKLYPNAYQIYCNLIDALIGQRWIDEGTYGLSVLDTYVDDWRGKRQTLVYPSPEDKGQPLDENYKKQFKNSLYNGKGEYEYTTNVDGVISTFSKNLTREKTKQVNTLTLFEEIRYIYQSILAKLSILEKMGMSGITQTNIDVAEGEFIAIHKSVNIREKFIISADFFRKLAEILYYKNSLSIISQNQDSLYASVYYGDYDLLAYLDDYCMYGDHKDSNAIEIKRDVKFFFNWLNSESVTSDKDKKNEPYFSYKDFRDRTKECDDNTEDPNQKSLSEFFKALREKYVDKLDWLKENGSPLYPSLPRYNKNGDNNEREQRITIMKINVSGFLDYNIRRVQTNKSEIFFFGSLDYCDFHRHKMRDHNLRTACYACKYYTRSIRILAANMFEDKNILQNGKTKSLGILKSSFKKNLLYTNSNSIRTLAQTLEGFGNVMFACASGKEYEREEYVPQYGINPNIIAAISKLLSNENNNTAIDVLETSLRNEKPLSRIDKSLLYYLDAYRFYLINADYNEAVGCLKKITTILTYYIEVLCYYPTKDSLFGDDNTMAITYLLYGSNDGDKFNPLADELFRQVARYTGYKYDHINISEINELKWIYSKELSDNIDLTKLSVYPDIRATWLRIVEIKIKGMKYLTKKEKDLNRKEQYKTEYMAHLRDTYPLIAPKLRNETTFYEEVLAYYTKVRYNDHIMNILLDGNPMVDRKKGGYTDEFHVAFYEKLANYLKSGEDKNRIDYVLFGTRCDKEDRLDLIEYLILDTLSCISNMVKVFTPHNHLTSYSKSFIAIVYNFYWEWARKYEFLYSLYQYQEAAIPIRRKDVKDSDENVSFNCYYWKKSFSDDNDDDCEKEYNRYDTKKADDIIHSIASGIRSENKDKEKNLRRAMNICAQIITTIPDNKEELLRFGLRSDRLYERLRHDIDDITINTIFSNYTAEMALRYYKLSEEANTEGEAYTEMISSLHFLNDDLNNDTCQFNIACDRFLLNCGVVERQRENLERLYRVSQVYDLHSAYIKGLNKMNQSRREEFLRSRFLNSEYL